MPSDPERKPNRERRHRLDPANYRGRKVVAFTACERWRRPGLADGELVDALVPMLASATAMYECLVPIYTFMPDHLHVLVTGTTDGADSLAAMEKFKDLSGWWLYRHRPKLKWQKDFYDHIVRYHEGWETQARYIALNPVRRGLAKDVASWPFTGSIGYDVKDILGDAFW